MATYTSRPTKKGMAQKAWDYFVQEYGKNIRELYYSPCCHGIRSWVCEFTITDRALMHWTGETVNWNIKDVSCQTLRSWQKR